ncbi:MAG: hypothetical protein ACREK5_01530 [Gemmatimonadota bacterium]
MDEGDGDQRVAGLDAFLDGRLVLLLPLVATDEEDLYGTRVLLDRFRQVLLPLRRVCADEDRRS